MICVGKILHWDILPIKRVKIQIILENGCFTNKNHKCFFIDKVKKTAVRSSTDLIDDRLYLLNTSFIYCIWLVFVLLFFLFTPHISFILGMKWRIIKIMQQYILEFIIIIMNYQRNFHMLVDRYWKKLSLTHSWVVKNFFAKNRNMDRPIQSFNYHRLQTYESFSSGESAAFIHFAFLFQLTLSVHC